MVITSISTGYDYSFLARLCVRHNKSLRHLPVRPSSPTTRPTTAQAKYTLLLVSCQAQIDILAGRPPHRAREKKR